MSERVVVPEFLSRAACDALLRTNHLSNPHQQGERIAEAICHALSEHPIVPTDEQLREMFPSVSHGVITHVMRWWAPRMFRAPEPERPQEIPHRWSVKSEDGQTYICRGEHEKSAGCEWEPWPPKPSEPEVPEAVKDLLGIYGGEVGEAMNIAVLEAYRRGLSCNPKQGAPEQTPQSQWTDAQHRAAVDRQRGK